MCQECFKNKQIFVLHTSNLEIIIFSPDNVISGSVIKVENFKADMIFYVMRPKRNFDINVEILLGIKYL